MNTAPLIDLIITETDRLEVCELLDMVSHALFKTPDISLDLISKNVRFGSAILSSLPQEFENLNIRLKNYAISDLIDKIKSIPATKILVAAMPTPEAQKALADYVTANTAEKNIVSFVLDPSILGGAVFMMDGKYTDLSVAKKLSEAFKGESLKKMLD